ncbi:MAG: glycosyltransferase family 4 protein, partial [Elusimicrobia bacterium]|nr:glycosyltransferase family 4 protein [Elusimicrobiota bacterium]
MAFRVLLVSYLYPPSIGGVERQSHLLARALVERGHSVRVVTSRIPASSPARERLHGVEIIRVPRGTGGRLRRTVTFLAAAALASIPWARWADVVQVQQALFPAATTALIARALGRPVVVRNSSSGPYGAVQLMRRLPLGRAALAIVARSSTLVALNADMVEELRLVGPARVVRIASGVEAAPEVTDAERSGLRAELGVPGGLVLYLGRLDEEKGVATLIRAWGLSAAERTELLVVGDGPSQAELVSLAARIGPRSRSIRFVGPTHEPGRYVRAADVLVLPSRSEGIANAGLEAMASGVPVVATDIGGNRELIAGPGLGTLVVPDDPRALARAIDDALLEPAAARARARAAREHVRAHHAIEGMVD